MHSPEIIGATVAELVEATGGPFDASTRLSAGRLRDRWAALLPTVMGVVREPPRYCQDTSACGQFRRGHDPIVRVEATASRIFSHGP